MKIAVIGVGALGPDFADWPALRALLKGTTVHQPARTSLPPPTMLPPAEQRRVGPAIKLALAVGGEALAGSGLDATTLATVFAASGGDAENCDALCRALAASAPQLSPTRFHNSVQNAAAGYWGIAQRATAPAMSTGAHDASFAVGLLEAATQIVAGQRPVLLVSSDTDYPEPLRATRPIPDALGVALLLAPPFPAAPATLRIEVRAGVADGLAQPSLESLRAAIPAGRALPLLQRMALGGAGVVHIEYLPALVLRVEVDGAA